ncbi:MAG: hypothetical protein Q9188_002877, partial [Gyalolechia gomerana]
MSQGTWPSKGPAKANVADRWTSHARILTETALRQAGVLMVGVAEVKVGEAEMEEAEMEEAKIVEEAQIVKTEVVGQEDVLIASQPIEEEVAEVDVAVEDAGGRKASTDLMNIFMADGEPCELLAADVEKQEDALIHPVVEGVVKETAAGRGSGRGGAAKERRRKREWLKEKYKIAKEKVAEKG